MSVGNPELEIPALVLAPRGGRRLRRFRAGGQRLGAATRRSRRRRRHLGPQRLHGDRHRRTGAGGRDHGHPSAPPDAGGSADPRPRVHRARRPGGQPPGRDARLWLLAAAVRRRSGRRRASAHARWDPARDHRRPAAGLLAHGCAARSRGAGAHRPRQGPPRRLQLPGHRPAASRRHPRRAERRRRQDDPRRLRQVPAAAGHEPEDAGGRAARPQRAPAHRRSGRRLWEDPLGAHGDDRDRPADRLRQRRQSDAGPDGGAGPGACRPRRHRRRARPPGPRDADRKPAVRRPRRRRRPGSGRRRDQAGAEPLAGPAAALRSDRDRWHVGALHAGPLRRRRPRLRGDSGAQARSHPPGRSATLGRPQRECRPRPQHHPQHPDHHPGGAGAGAPRSARA